MPVDPALVRLATLTHDIGKAHPGFQAYLSDSSSHPSVPHAAPSAWWTLALGFESELPAEDVIWAAETVRRHHTGLVNFQSDMLTFWNSDDAAAVRLPNWEAAQALLPKLENHFKARGLPQLGDLFWDLEHDPGLETWLSVRLLYSLLIAADRMDALGVYALTLEALPGLQPPTFSDAHSAVNRWRQETQEACFQNALELIHQPGLYTLTLPTGAGKTLTGFRIASALMQQFDLRSLIYVLPFISIVEQTADSARNYFPSHLLQEDHSLKLMDKEEGYDPWQHLTANFRYWRQPLILTTLAQFWEALFAPQANQTMNFHRLTRAVIILDEPQTLPPKYWTALGQLFETLAAKLGSYFILMTATQPQIGIQPGVDKEIAPQTYRFPEKRHRYQVCNIEEPVLLPELETLLREEELITDSTQGMLVLNTKRSALQAYDLVARLLGPDKQVNKLFLSAWLTPWRRRKVLEALRSLEKNKQPRILVSTQVVEAGVDLDFAWVVRDLGPLDSIIQVAGRCNRHHHQAELGQVFMTWLKDERDRTFSGMVYAQVLLQATREVLQNKRQFGEEDVPKMVRDYYAAILDRLTPEDLVGDLKRGNWDQMPKLYEEQLAPQSSVIVEETAEVAALVETLENTHWTLENLTSKRENMRQLQQYVIEIPERVREQIALHCGQHLHDEQLFRQVLGGKMWFLSREMIGEEDSQLYHPIKGLVPPDTDTMFLNW